MSERTRVLLADSDAALCRTLSWILADHGYEAVSAGDRASALARLQSEPVEALLLDRDLPGADDLGLLREVRQDARFAALPVVLVTALPPEDDAALAVLGVPLRQVVVKPFKVREVLEALRRAMRARLEAALGGSHPADTELVEAFAASRRPEELFTRMVQGVARQLQIPSCSVILARPGEKTGRVVAASDNPAIADFEVQLERYPEISGALETGEHVIVYDVMTDPRFEAVRARWQREGISVRTRSAAALRLGLRSGPVGVFLLRTMTDDTPLSGRDVQYARRIVDAAVAPLERLYASA